MSEKAVAFDHLRPLLEPEVRVFGAAILQGNVSRSPPAQALINFYNRKGIFSNAADTGEELEAELKKRFASVEIEVKGVVALFKATG